MLFLSFIENIALHFNQIAVGRLTPPLRRGASQLSVSSSSLNSPSSASPASPTSPTSPASFQSSEEIVGKFYEEEADYSRSLEACQTHFVSKLSVMDVTWKASFALHQ